MSKKLFALFLCAFAWSPLVAQAQADAKQELLSYLKANTGFTANFSLTATDPKGKVLNQQTGEIRGQRPNNLYLHTVSPTENYVAVLGSSVTYYDPFVEQVTVSKLDESQPMPFIYLLSDTASAWQQAAVSKKGSCYQVNAPQLSSSYKYLQACVVNGALTEFSYVEVNGNKATYTFTNYKSSTLNENSFKISYPKATQVVVK
ncbi:outer membrane lipoprotein chaperone LolA [Psittacicella gerlachiana]|uniref:Outer-membrane lipoprotein carrier protein n=1 Tax=Psittacicella gerlachiana TaxID=2028574 RepID=A0A3A1YEN4_9GAMM|nr:outer membrane lipoprotein chaperone LolA [Psittacicella gerlachiana]RIY35729.1 outer membrane lipoprotein carrier protein LolA [Psittacicella gerlachiana]